MTIRLQDETDVLVKGVKPNSSRISIASALRLETKMDEQRLLKVADLILANQEVSIICENQGKAEVLCAALLSAGCEAIVEK